MESAVNKIKNFLVGIVVGIASMLPGVSGAVLAVCFGIYERLIEDLADVFHKIRTDFMFLMLVALGIAAGMFLSAFGLDYVFTNYEMATLFFFVGLIGGQIPTLYYLTEPEKKSTSANYASLIIGILIMVVLGILMFTGEGTDKTIGHDISSYIYMVAIGIFLAISKIAPGISGSTILVVLGLYGPLLDAMTSMDLALLIPVGIGLVIGILGFSKVMDYALKNYRKSSYFMIFGLTIGSLGVVVLEAADGVTGALDVVVGILTLILGVIVSLWFMKLGQKNKYEIPE